MDVRPFEPENLADLWVDESLYVERDALAARANRHLPYFVRYLKHLQANAVIVEQEYVDADYLSDYAHYYATCFENHPTRCQRLHFFALDDHQLKSFLEDIEALPPPDVHDEAVGKKLDANRDLALEGLQKHYLGFMVLKPLRDGFIGRTCLKAYQQDAGQHTRFYPAVRPYTVHLGGITLTIKSMAFQEQDEAVGMCATTAIWSALHVVAPRYNRQIPSPAEITRLAVDHRFSSVRPMPSGGLHDYDMANAVRGAGLDPIAYTAPELTTPLLLGLIQGYSDVGVTPILGVKLWRKEGSGNDAKWEHIGDHAVTVSGYAKAEDLQTQLMAPTESVRVRTMATGIRKFYIHDDQKVPFARTDIEAMPAKMAGKAKFGENHDGWWLNTQWGDDHRAVVETVVIPAYHKMRIPYEEICRQLQDFEAILAGPLDNFREKASWDITMMISHKLQAEFSRLDTVNAATRRSLAWSNWPHYCWRARLWVDQDAWCDIVFDATATPSAFCAHRIILFEGYREDFQKHILQELLKRLETFNWWERRWIELMKQATANNS